MSHMFTPVNQNARSQRHLLREFSDFYFFNCDLIIQLRDPIFFRSRIFLSTRYNYQIIYICFGSIFNLHLKILTNHA